MKVNHVNGLEAVLVDYDNHTFKYYDDTEDVTDFDIEIWLKNPLTIKLLISDLEAARFTEL